MTASLGMYDFPHLASANASLWAAVRQELGFGPEHLTQAANLMDVWSAPDLVFAQTCGLPYRARLFGQVQVVGTPDYGIPGCMPGYYCSYIVAQPEGPEAITDFDTPRFALNEPMSQSGWGAPWQIFQNENMEIEVLPPTGSHVNSALTVAEGHADLAAIDAVTWRHMERMHPDIVGALRIIGQTPATAAPPFITGRAQDGTAVRQAVERAVNTLDGIAKMALGLRGVVFIPESAYLSLPVPPHPGNAPGI